MALPETDLHRIRLWTRERVPEHLWDQLKRDVYSKVDENTNIANLCDLV